MRTTGASQAPGPASCARSTVVASDWFCGKKRGSGTITVPVESRYDSETPRNPVVKA